jgi:hypothetical protein
MSEDGASPGALPWRDGATAVASIFALEGVRGAGDRGATPTPRAESRDGEPILGGLVRSAAIRVLAKKKRREEQPIGRARRAVIRKTVLDAWRSLLSHPASVS